MGGRTTGEDEKVAADILGRAAPEVNTRPAGGVQRGYTLFNTRFGKKKSPAFRLHLFATCLQKSRRPSF